LTPIRVTQVLAPGAWSGSPDDRVTLSYDDRYRRRILLTSHDGVRALLDLPNAILLADGSGLALEDGRILEVRALAERLMEVRAQDRASLLRLAWHIGNRHLSVEIKPDCLRIRHDEVIALMLAGLGATVTEIQAPFDPEGGAYGGRHTAHDHGGDHRAAETHDP